MVLASVTIRCMCVVTFATQKKNRHFPLLGVSRTVKTLTHKAKRNPRLQGKPSLDACISGTAKRCRYLANRYGCFSQTCGWIGGLEEAWLYHSSCESEGGSFKS